MKYGNNDQSAPWHVLVSRAARVPPALKFYAGFPTEAEAKAVAEDRNADQGEDGEYRYTVAAKPENQ